MTLQQDLGWETYAEGFPCYWHVPCFLSQTYLGWKIVWLHVNYLFYAILTKGRVLTLQG